MRYRTLMGVAPDRGFICAYVYQSIGDISASQSTVRSFRAPRPGSPAGCGRWYTQRIAPPQPPTSHDVARAAGVSQPTVSRALRNDPRLTAQTITRVRDAAEALSYVPIQRGRNLATRRTGQIGVVVTDLRNPFYLEIFSAVHEALRRANMRMIILTPDTEDRVELEQLADGSLDGAILTTVALDSPLPQQLCQRGFPFVLLNREIDDCPGDVCVVDNLAGARLVAQELLGLGHVEIAAVFGPSNTSTGRDRERGFREALGERGVLLPDANVRRSAFGFSDGRRATLELIDAAPHAPTALFCANDMSAFGALDALRSRGLAVPADVTVIGFDDVAQASWDAFGLTTVAQEIQHMAGTAAELLLSRLGAGVGPPAPQRVVLPAQLRRRRTHGPPSRGRSRLTHSP